MSDEPIIKLKKRTSQRVDPAFRTVLDPGDMERNQGRRRSAEEKLRMVAVGRQSGATVSERGSWFAATSALLGKGNSGQLLPGEGR